jgi:threonine dehydratase
LADERGAVLVPSFDDPFVIAGQGTIGLEILEQASEIGATIGRVLACCGGGGLVGGIATAIKDTAPTSTSIASNPKLLMIPPVLW